MFLKTIFLILWTLSMSDPLQPVFPSGCCPWTKKNIKFRHNIMILFFAGWTGSAGRLLWRVWWLLPSQHEHGKWRGDGDTCDWWRHCDCVKGASDFSSSINFRHTYDRITAKNKEELINYKRLLHSSLL